MAENFESVKKMFIGETVERFTRTTVEGLDLASLSGAEGGNGVAKAVLRTLDKYVPKFVYPHAGTLVASFLSKPGILDRIFPDDSVPGVKIAKLILENLPPIVIGGSESFGDAVERAVDSISSNSSVATSGQDKLLDWGYLWSEREGVILLPLIDPDTKEAYWEYEDSENPKNNIPVVSDERTRRALDRWYAMHPSTTRTVGQGNNRRTEIVPGERPPPFMRYPLSVCFRMIGSDAKVAGDVEGLKKLLAGKKDWFDSLNDNAKRLRHALSATAASLEGVSYAVAEDFLKDLKEKATPSEMNDLGDQYVSEIQADGTLPEHIYNRIMAHVDIFMGAELEGKTSVKVWLKRAYTAYKSKSLPLGKAVLFFMAGIGLTAPVFIMLIGALLTFLTSAYLFIWAASADAGQAFMGMEDGQSMATSAALVCMWTLLILLTFLSPIELALGIVTKFLKWEKGWLTDIGKKIGALIGIYGGIAVAMLHYGVSTHYRFFLPLTAAMAMGVAYLINRAENTEGENGRLGMKAGKFFTWVVAAVFVYMVLGSLWEVFGAIATEWAGKAYGFILLHKVLSFIVLLVVSLVLSGFILQWFETNDSYENGEWSRTRTPSYLARTAAFVIVVVLSGWAFVEEPNQRAKWFHTPTATEIAETQKKKAEADAKALAEHQARVRQQQAQRVAVSHRSPTPEKKRARRKVRRFDDRAEPDCNDLAYDDAKALGCF